MVEVTILRIPTTKCMETHSEVINNVCVTSDAVEDFKNETYRITFKRKENALQVKCCY